MSESMRKNSPKKQVPASRQRDAALRRHHKVTVLLNDKELEAIEVYCKKYRQKSKSTFLREAALRSVMTRFLEDYPTLFEKRELDNLVVTAGSTGTDD